MVLATPQMLQLPNAIVRRGGNLKIVDGWANRGVNGLPMAPSIKGSMQHWIVSKPKPGVDRPSLGVVLNGHSTLKGPLANLHLDFDGDITLLAGGRANHGGVGSWKGISGNQFWIATEAEGPPFTDAQINAYAIIVCAIADVTGQHPRDWSPSHKEYAPNRKVDIGDYIYTIRQKAIALYEGKNGSTMALTNQQAYWLEQVYYACLTGGAGMPDNGKSMASSLNDLQDVLWEGGPGTALENTIAQRLWRVERDLQRPKFAFWKTENGDFYEADLEGGTYHKIDKSVLNDRISILKYYSTPFKDLTKESPVTGPAAYGREIK